MVKQERAARTRQALILSAAEVFDREGFTVASLTAISSQAGVSNGALHFHFASKAELAFAVETVALHRLAALTMGGGGAVAHNGVTRISSLQMLVNATHALARSLAEDVVLRAGFELSGSGARDAEQNLRRHWRQWVEQVLERAHGAGELEATVAAQDVMAAVVAATVGFEVLGNEDPLWLSASTLTRFWQLLLPRLATATLLTALTPHPTPEQG